MDRRTLRLAAVLAVVVLVSSLAPGLAVGVGEAESSFTSPGIAIYSPDAYEAGGDNAKVDARFISSVPGPGEDPYTESHTLHDASGTTADYDWYAFEVTADDITHKRAFLIEAATNFTDCDTRIELYGPGLAWTPLEPLDGTQDPVAIAGNDDGTFMWHGSSLTYLPYTAGGGGAGTYRFRVRPYASGGDYDSCAGPYTMRIKKGTLERIYGSNRIATAIEISQEQWETNLPATLNRAVVLANAYNYPDALAGSILAGIGTGPILLSEPDHLPAAVETEIARLGVDTVYVLGGENALSAQVVADLAAMSSPPQVFRVAGNDRYQTAAAIALRAQLDDGSFGETISDLAIVVSGENFPDALAASALGAAMNVPVLLTPSTHLGADAAAAIAALGTTDVVVVGGPGAVSNTVVASLQSLVGSTRVLRIWGGDRYETAKSFAAWACDLDGPTPPGDGWIGTAGNHTAELRLFQYNVGVASGEDFPDALAGGVMVGHHRHPLLLNPKDGVTDYIFEEHSGKLPAGDTDYFGEINGDAILSSRLFGGPGAVSDTTYLMLDQFFGFTMN